MKEAFQTLHNNGVACVYVCLQQDGGAMSSKSSSRALVSLFTEPPECFLGLNTIASSPLDNATLPPPHTDATLTKPHVRTPAAINEPSLAGEDSTSVGMRGMKLGSHKDSKESGELLSDSGCSDTNEDSADLAGFIDSENDNSCHCDELGSVRAEQEEEEEQFDLEINNDLDLEQIEKD